MSIRFRHRALLIAGFAVTLAAAPANKVGETTREFAGDANTNWRGAAKHVLVTEIWYPAPGNVDETAQPLGDVFEGGKAARDAPIAPAPKSFPLILISHGTGGQARQLAWLADALAAHGFIVAGPNHPGNNATEDYTPQGFALWWERARDISTMLTGLLADTTFGPRIDSSRIGAAGFSLGGYTMIELAGGTTDMTAFRKYCQTHRDFCEGPPEFPNVEERLEQAMQTDPTIDQSMQRAGQSYRDTRIHAVFAIAPALGVAFEASDLSKITIPVQIVVGSKDPMAPAAENAQHFAQFIRHATLNIIPGASHYTFLDVCTPEGIEKLPQFCGTEPMEDRAKFHQQVSAMAISFFKQKLR